MISAYQQNLVELAVLAAKQHGQKPEFVQGMLKRVNNIELPLKDIQDLFDRSEELEIDF